ncbi:L,D-transpeptidase family protein [Anaerobacillus isosaccharinicus]|uniref:L,D-transpeptidase family protein n=1 Tax=Anaerobacillus isosaccharinicus TaxID=1532552 RepID=A0A1S2KX51_9BACI|nr:L,D-transpeptidase family protein [Anaerobacillus isosaccharinicus]MBA5586821.1 L,D-transpeptidase family protein [Anaerobacillus isosaccharinicus]QOY34966.1 L,D-transpeptidase family protein [Anaerobacillus isosaccharinicus]
MSIHNRLEQRSTTRKKRHKVKKKKFIIPIILMVIIVYSLGVFTSDFVASIKPNFVPLQESLTIESKSEASPFEENLNLGQHSPSTETLISVSTVEEIPGQETIGKEDEKALHSKSKKPEVSAVHLIEKETKTETEQVVVKTEVAPQTNKEPVPVPLKPSAKQVVSHVVQSNETLFSITMKYYLSGSFQSKVADYNNIKNPSTDIKAGMVLELPDPLITAFHEVKQGETLFSITMNYYQASQYQDPLATFNGIKNPTIDVKAGMILQIPTLSIINNQPKGSYSIKINKGTNQLIVYLNNEQVRTFPIATGKNSSLTPEGTFKIVNKVEKPWFNPENIPGGDSRNPLGSHWLGLNVPGTNGYTYGIHGTNNPASIGSYASKGCIRMHNSDIQWLYQHLPMQTIVEIVN